MGDHDLLLFHTNFLFEPICEMIFRLVVMQPGREKARELFIDNP